MLTSHCRQADMKKSTLARFGMKLRPIPEVVNSAQTPKSREIRKVAGLKVGR